MDQNFLSFANEEVGEQSLGSLVPPPGTSDTLKFSNAWNGSVEATVIQGGIEDCMDANNGSRHLKVRADDWRSGGSQVITIKGGCEDIEVSGLITTKGRVVDVDLDNYSDQNHGASKNIRLNLRTDNGSPVTWRSLKGCRPIILNPEQRYKCQLYLPWIIGVIWDRFYQLLKLLHICA